MKKSLLTAAFLAIAFTWLVWAQQPAADPVLQAMHDELDRAMKLAVPNLDTPYFVEYLLEEADTFSVGANLGGVVERSRNRFRAPSVRMRVGDYKFDNSNFAGGAGGSRYDLQRFPIEDSYPVLRRYFWLTTDSAFKAAVETISASAPRFATLPRQS